MLKNTFYPTVLLAVALLMSAMLPVRPVSAAQSFTVNSVLDEIDADTSDGVCQSAANHCTLRAAIMQANHLTAPGVTTIIVPAGTYTLVRPKNGLNGEDNGDLNLTAPLDPDQTIVINGAGAANTIIDANQIDGVIRIATGRTAIIGGVTIRNGNRQPPASSGSGILSDGTLTITDCVIEKNDAEYFGGGIYSYGTLNVIRSTIRLNVGADRGGGLYLGGPTIIRDSTIYANGSDYGGGIYNSNLLYVINSTVSQNYSKTDGGGIYNSGTTGVTGLYNTSVINNDADHDRDENGGIGGGIYVAAGTRFIVVNSLIAANTILNAPIYNDCNGILEAYGLNLLGEETGCTFSGNGTASRGFISLNTIGPLQNNGGPTWTHALLAGSVAIDTTFDSLGCVNETGALLTTDQRGAPRPVGVRCDVGAFEYSPPRYLYLPLIVR